MARWSDDGATVHVWSHSQGIHALRRAIAAALALDPSAVSVEHVESAGCYGHNAADDAAFDAVLLARTVPGRPVLLRWTRRDELTWASALPGDHRDSLGPAGRRPDRGLVVRRMEPGPHLATRVRRPAGAAGDGPSSGRRSPATCGRPARSRRVRRPPQRDPALRRRPTAGSPGTASPRRRCARSAMRCARRRTSTCSRSSRSWTSWPPTPGSTRVDFRLAHLSDPRARAVVELAARASGWGRAAGRLTGRGVGFARYKENGAWCAVVAEVEVETDVRVRRLTVAADLGLVINPDGARNQLSGGAVQSTSWTMRRAGPLRPAPGHQRRLGVLPDPAVPARRHGSTYTSSTATSRRSAPARRRRDPPRPRSRTPSTPRSAYVSATCP